MPRAIDYRRSISISFEQHRPRSRNLREDKIHDVRRFVPCSWRHRVCLTFNSLTRLYLTCLFFTILSAGGGVMQSSQEPPPPLAADASLSALQAQMAVENLCVASSNMLDLIRTLRLSILLMDEDTIAAEEEWQVTASKEQTRQCMKQVAELEAELLKLKNQME